MLAFDTCFGQCGVALAEAGTSIDIVACDVRETARGHAAMLAPMIDRTLRSAGWRPSDLDLIAVTIGPGSFTGVRIGMAMARGLAIAVRCPVAGILTTDALLLQAAQDAPEIPTAAAIVAAIVSGRGDYFLATALGMPFAGSARTLAAHLGARPAILVGDGAQQLAIDLRALGEKVEIDPAQTSISPGLLARHALSQGIEYWRDDNMRNGLPRPLYLRGADVTSADGVRTTADIER